MKNRIFQCVALIVLVLSFAGCTAFHLRDGNEQLTSYYYAKKQANKDTDWRMLENIRSSLNTLAADAAKQAQREKSVLNQIAFYRIATTAAWQSGDINVVTYADDGSKLCTDENFNLAPRDCGMLLVIPLFAAVDETTDRFNKLQAEVSKAPADQRASFTEDTQKIFDDYNVALATILKHRPKLADSAAHPDFLIAVDQNSGNLLCDLIEQSAVGLIATTRGDVPKAKCEVYKLKKNAFDTGLNQSCAKCLPESKDKLIELKPHGCL